jgi:hypothetical protein
MPKPTRISATKRKMRPNSPKLTGDGRPKRLTGQAPCRPNPSRCRRSKCPLGTVTRFRVRKLRNG